MNKLESLCLHIIEKSEAPISELKLGYLVYLCDWASALYTKKKITDKKYEYFMGSIKNDILDSINYSPYFKTITENQSAGIKRTTIISSQGDLHTTLTKKEVSIVNSILSKVGDFYFNELVLYVASTKPLNEPEIYTILDLEESARTYVI